MEERFNKGDVAKNFPLCICILLMTGIPPNDMLAIELLAADAIHVEQDLLEESVGSQDQVAAAYGGFNRIDFNRDGSIDARQLLTSPERLAVLQQHFALFFTGFVRTASEIAKEQIRLTPHRQRELQKRVNGLRRKLEAEPSFPRYIVTEPAVGYRLEILPPEKVA